MNLDNVKMNVIQTAGNGVVNEKTVFTFSHTENFVSASYSGGEILKGYLVGIMDGSQLTFSYCQLQHNGTMDNGQSVCEVSVEHGKIRLIEHFEWASRPGEKGVNIFQQL